MVKVEALPSPVFWEVELYLRSRLSTQPDRTKKKIPTTFRPTPDSMATLSARKRSSSGDGDDSTTDGIGTGGGAFNADASADGNVGGGGTITDPRGTRGSSAADAAVVAANGCKSNGYRERGAAALNARVSNNGDTRARASSRSPDTKRSGAGSSADGRSTSKQNGRVTSTAGSRPRPEVNGGRVRAGGRSAGIAEREFQNGVSTVAAATGWAGSGIVGWVEDPADILFREGGGAAVGVGVVGKRQKIAGSRE